MHITHFSELAIQLLIVVADNPGKCMTIREAAQILGVSRNHLMKVTNKLAHSGLLAPKRGRTGGIYITKTADHIRMSDVLRITEPDITSARLLTFTSATTLPKADTTTLALRKALQAFLHTLDDYSIADLCKKSENT